MQPGAPAGDEPVLKKVDAWWTVLFVDPIAVRLVRITQDISAVTPMRLTLVAHVLGLVAAALYGADALILAAILFEVRFVLDCADGKLARARGTSSEAGGFVDYVGDYIVVGADMVAIALLLAWGEHVPWALAVALPASYLAHIAADQAYHEQVAKTPPSPSPRPSPTGYRGWMAARRLRPLPGRIDVEHGLLFVVPIVAAVTDRVVLAAAAWAATIFFSYKVLRLTANGYRLATARDADA